MPKAKVSGLSYEDVRVVDLTVDLVVFATVDLIAIAILGYVNL
jgi:hypothetical protein